LGSEQFANRVQYRHEGARKELLRDDILEQGDQLLDAAGCRQSK
jgi:hypothetical protein